MNWNSDIFEAIAKNHPELKHSGFAHIANIKAIEAMTSFDFGEGLHIRKASEKEANSLRLLVSPTRTHALAPISTRNPYETELHTKVTNPSTTTYLTKDLPENEWRYHVITFDGSNSQLLELIDASVCTQVRLKLGPTVIGLSDNRGLAYQGAAGMDLLWNELSSTEEPLLTLSVSDLEDLKQVYKKIRDMETDHVGLREAISRFTQLDRIPNNSPLQFLGYVAILESLITHKPDPKDPYDSLTRQVRQKMLLVGRRCKIPIRYDIFACRVPPDTLWNRLYEYRSTIAHGAKINFCGKLQCLNSPKTALTFIRSATAAVMRQTLEEPDLIADLRAC